MINISESVENYLKAIHLISKHNKGGWVSNSEISEYLKIKPASVSNMLYRLRDNNFIDWKPRQSLRLTKKGKQIADSIMENYNILYDFFKKVLHISDNAQVEELCCGIEHHITPEVSKALEDFIIEYE